MNGPFRRFVLRCPPDAYATAAVGARVRSPGAAAWRSQLGGAVAAAAAAAAAAPSEHAGATTTAATVRPATGVVPQFGVLRPDDAPV